MPSAFPGWPEVRANTMSTSAMSTRLLNRFAPLMIQSSPSRRAVVSSQVASLPWLGSVSPKAISASPLISRSR
jgi:hypothetical protein